MMDERCQALLPGLCPRVCGQEWSQRNDCPLRGKLQGRGIPFEFSFSSFLFFFFKLLFKKDDLSQDHVWCSPDHSLQTARSQRSAAARILLCSAQGPCHLSRQGESSMASHFNKLATVFTLPVLGLGSLVFQEIPRILMFFSKWEGFDAMHFISLA